MCKHYIILLDRVQPQMRCKYPNTLDRKNYWGGLDKMKVFHQQEKSNMIPNI